jgi:hypothetical protein
VQVPADAAWVLGATRVPAKLVMQGGKLTGEAA